MIDPKALLSTLVDVDNRLQRGMKELSDISESVRHEIMSLLLQTGETQAFGSDGTGLSLTSRTSYQYDGNVFNYLEGRGLLKHFERKPSITRDGLEKLKKSGELTERDMKFIEEHTIEEQSPYSLRRVVPKEAMVIP